MAHFSNIDTVNLKVSKNGQTRSHASLIVSHVHVQTSHEYEIFSCFFSYQGYTFQCEGMVLYCHMQKTCSQQNSLCAISFRLNLSILVFTRVRIPNHDKCCHSGGLSFLVNHALQNPVRSWSSNMRQKL